MESLLSDWRFWFAVAGVLGPFAGLVILLAEARFKIAAHARILDPGKIAEWNRRDATLIKTVETLARDMVDLKTDLRELATKYDRGSARLWGSIEKNNARLSWCEAKINGRREK